MSRCSDRKAILGIVSIILAVLLTEACAFQPGAHMNFHGNRIKKSHNKQFLLGITVLFSTMSNEDFADKIFYETTTNDLDLLQILELQRGNLPDNLNAEEAKKEGFVTIEHDLPTLQALSNPYGHVVAKISDEIVGYALTMLPMHRNLVPFLQPILKEIEEIALDDKVVKDHKYCIMGQICIAKEFRGRGIFPALYEKMKAIMKDAGYDYIITGVALSNMRSRRAHEKVGFVALGDESPNEEDKYQNIVLRIR